LSINLTFNEGIPHLIIPGQEKATPAYQIGLINKTDGFLKNVDKTFAYTE